MKSIKLSTYVLIIITVFSVYYALRFKKRIEWDVREYYLYLPATFIHHDLGFNFIEKLPEAERNEYKNWVGPSPSGKIVSRMTMGMAIAYTPFFWIGHLFAKVLDEPQTGFSSPYQTAMDFCGPCYGILGLFFLLRILRRYFPERIAALTLLCIGLGTNLFYYMAVEGSMSHVVSFCLFSIFLWYTIQWHEKQQHWKYIIPIALSLGLVSLVRPTNLMLCILFILYGITDIASLKAKISLLLKNYQQMLGIIFIMFLIALPQLLYWHAQTGHYIYYSYGKQRFFFDRPRIWKGLFSYRKGWFIYTPIMLLAVAGLFRLKKYAPALFVPIIIFTVINIYVLLSWWCWWYGGGFGMRAFIESYVFLSIPIAAFFMWVGKNMKVLLASLLFSFAAIYLNIFQTFQYANGWLHWDSISKDFYWATFNRKGWLPEDVSKKLQDPPDYDAAMEGKSEEKGK